MDLIYQNFDGLDVSFQGAVPEQILQELEMARQQAERNRSPVTVRLGNDETPVVVAESGMRGGYRYRFDTGLDGETWCIANSNDPSQWNIRVSVKSLSLALYGYKGAKERIYAMLEKLEAKGSGETNAKTGEIYEFPKEAISRVDYCFDFKSSDFLINPDYLIAHSRCKKNYFYPQQIVSTGRRITYSRIGSMPNRQIVLYDKILEIQEKNKPFWWQIWNLKKEEFNQKIWRIEVRAGKKELKNWNLRSFDDFEEKIGDVILAILNEIKYVSPNLNDTNQARWPLSPFWAEAQKAAKNALLEYISHAKRNPVIEEYKNALINRYKNQMAGMLPAYAAITGKADATQIPGVLEALYGEFSENAQKNKSQIDKKIKKAKNKFVFLDKSE
jgi:hypothetical protein